jgi:hypothetical protein
LYDGDGRPKMAEPTIWRAYAADSPEHSPDLSALEDVWKAIRAELRWVYAERMEEITLCRAANLAGGIAAWPTGRAFGPAIELRWERSETGYRLVILSEDTPPPEVKGLAWQKAAVCQKAVERKALLWGEHNAETETWLATQIPRPFAYPVDEVKKRVRLVGLDYCQGEITLITRLKEVESYEPEADSSAAEGGGP